MGTVALGLRNVYRNQARALLVVLVLGLSVGLFITLLKTGASTQAESRALKAQAATLIEVNEAGNPSGIAGTVTPEMLPTDVSRLLALPHVVRVERYVQRQFVDNQRTPPTGVLIGVEPGATLRLQSMGGFVGTPKLLEGRDLRSEDAGQPLAVVGKRFAQSRGVRLGEEFTVPGRELQRGKWIYPHPIADLKARVIGIFAVGVVYADNQVFVPLDVAQEVMGIGKGRVGQYIVTVDSAEHVADTAKALREVLGAGVDVISQDLAALQTADALEAVSANSRVGGAIAAVVGALVVLFTMLLVTRERTREIGVLKAIGASHGDVAGLFTAETIALALLGGLLGLLIYTAAGSALGFIILGTLGAEGAVGASYGLTAGEIAQGLGLALLFGVIGSLYAVVRAIRLRPSEAIRQR